MLFGVDRIGVFVVTYSVSEVMEFPVYTSLYIDKDTASYTERAVEMRARLLIQVRFGSTVFPLGSEEDYASHEERNVDDQ